MIQATSLLHKLGVLIAVFAPFLLVLAFYTHQKLLLCRVDPVPELATELAADETTPLLRVGSSAPSTSYVRDTHQDSPESDAPSRNRGLTLWTLCTAFLDLFAYLAVPYLGQSWKMPCRSSFDCTVEWLYLVYLAMVGCLPLVGKLQILLYSHLLQRPDFQDKAETLRMLTRQAMLDGIFLPPLLSLWTTQVYPYMEGIQIFFIFVPFYMSQGLVWAYFFRRSKDESSVARRLADLPSAAT